MCLATDYNFFHGSIGKPLWRIIDKLAKSWNICSINTANETDNITHIKIRTMNAA